MKKGDLVIVTNTGEHYAHHKEAFRELGFKNPDTYRNSSDLDLLAQNKTVFTVTGIIRGNLVGIESPAQQQFVVETKGLKLVELPFKVGDVIIPVKAGANDISHAKSNKAYMPSDIGKPLGKIVSIELDSDNKNLVAVTDNGYVVRVQEYANHFRTADNSEFEQQKETTAEMPQKDVKMKVVKTKEIPVKGINRQVTIAVLLMNGLLRAGYSVRMPEDKEDKKLAEAIATGRANNDRTNLLEMQVGFGMDKKFILHAVADDLLRQISEGKIDIKGIKTPKTETKA